VRPRIAQRLLVLTDLSTAPGIHSPQSKCNEPLGIIILTMIKLFSFISSLFDFSDMMQVADTEALSPPENKCPRQMRGGVEPVC
jgi:hypothetical protein